MFWVKVPVLSVQMTFTVPRVSTEGSLRTRAFCFTIRFTAMAKEMVTMAGSPSGTAATAKLSPVSSMERGSSPRISPIRLTAPQMPTHPKAIHRPSLLSRCWRGVGGDWVCFSIPAMAPIWVWEPMWVTRALPRPAAMVLPMYTRPGWCSHFLDREGPPPVCSPLPLLR